MDCPFCAFRWKNVQCIEEGHKAGGLSSPSILDAMKGDWLMRFCPDVGSWLDSQSFRVHQRWILQRGLEGDRANEKRPADTIVDNSSLERRTGRKQSILKLNRPSGSSLTETTTFTPVNGANVLLLQGEGQYGDPPHRDRVLPSEKGYSVNGHSKPKVPRAKSIDTEAR